METVKAMTMKMQAQLFENATAKLNCSKAFLELYNENNGSLFNTTSERLRSCQADVFETENYFVLRSYKTFIACIRKDTGDCFDVLRHEYGYTATSAQHVSKFIKDYGKSGGKRYTYRDI